MGSVLITAASGLPQLDFNTWPSQIFWLVVTLVVLFLIMSRMTLPRIAATIEEREDTILGDLDMAAEYDQKAQEAEAAYAKALEAARSEARKIANQTHAEIQTELDAALAEADKRIAAKTAESAEKLGAIQAEAKLRAAEVAKDVAAALVAQLSPISVDGARISEAVDDRIAAGRFGG